MRAACARSRSPTLLVGPSWRCFAEACRYSCSRCRKRSTIPRFDRIRRSRFRTGGPQNRTPTGNTLQGICDMIDVNVPSLVCLIRVPCSVRLNRFPPVDAGRDPSTVRPLQHLVTLFGNEFTHSRSCLSIILPRGHPYTTMCAAPVLTPDHLNGTCVCWPVMHYSSFVV